jgi:HEAT repeat protein
MEFSKAVRVLACRTLWNSTGLRSAGRALVKALGSEDETVRTMAGMSLVQTGERSEPLLEEALSRRENLPLVLQILADIGDPDVASELERFTDDPDPETARAARSALRTLRASADSPT